MPLFQKAVVEKYLNAQNKKTVSDQWNVYQAHFLNPTIQENIRNSKEEQYQGEFLIDLFVNVLGYTKNPTPNFNLTTELKNEKDSKKADGGIIVNDTVIGVIELKGTNTTDLGKIEVQAFGYKNNQKDCVYVITSNFEKLRFYIDNAIENIEFNLFQLTEKEFALLYMCLGLENLSKNIPKKIKEESVNQENQITKELYKDYSVFKNNLFHNLIALNPEYEPLELFKKSQKLIDRFLFLFFAEDRQLLPPNSVRLILDDWKDLQERDVEIPLYDRYKKYFEYLNTGYKGKRYDVFAYNGGLFKPDAILDTVKIDDAVLYNHTLKLATYDFASEVDVNILGHIFENSLNELDEMKAQLEGAEIDKAKTKRKKDGVFYTPKYITKYIVANTVGTLCEEKKTALQLDETEYNTDKKRTKATKQPLLEKLTKYRDWLLQITIIDPACGSGAFLNEALNFLIAEHSFIDELQAKLFGDAMVLSDVEKSILENNLFGVDLNEESVEIAKLSLWLRTAQPNRKLNDLNNNIKCGNSLIDDDTIAGAKAFVWEKEFPQIFAKGGFDVVIGNPPYVKEATNKNAFTGLHNHACYQGKMDLWYLFGYLGIKICKKDNGLVGYIAPNNWITNDGASKFRNFILENAKLLEFIDFGDFKVFESAGIQTMIYIMQRNNDNAEYSFQFSKIVDKNISINNVQEFLLKTKSQKSEQYSTNINKNSLVNNIFSFSNNTKNQILDKMLKNSNFYLDKNEISSGIDIGQDFVNAKSQSVLGNKFNIGDGVFNLSMLEFENYQFLENEKKLLKPFYTTKEVNRYLSNSNNNLWVIYTPSSFKNPDKILPYPTLKKHLDQFKKIITSDNKPYGIHRTRNEEIFKGEKILSVRKCSRPTFSYVPFDSYVNRTFNIIKSERINLKYLNGILNSNLIKFYLKERGKMQGDIFQVDINPLLSLPINLVDSFQKDLIIDNGKLITKLNENLILSCEKFQRTIQRKFDIEDLPKKLQDWYNLSYSEFIKELTKKKIKLSLSDEAEWEDYFTQESKKALDLKAQIDATDKAIDAIVYELYGLTKEEIEIVENS